MALRPGHVAPELLNKVTKALGITALDQWYYVSHTAVAQAIGARALNKFGGTSGFLKLAYPNHHFDEEKLSSKTNLEKDQKFMEVVIRKLFPNTEIQTKARKSVGIINPETDAYLEIDFWMPELKLGIEYQDKHHFEYQWYANATLEDYKKRDNLKKATMPTLGYTLITIGCWWDKSLESVAATIRNFRPDLLQEYEGTHAEPIPPDPPPGFIAAPPVIPGVAGIMSPFIPSYNFDPTNWYLIRPFEFIYVIRYAGEKHDGIRGVFNPELNKMFSRSGNELSILPSLLHDIPNMLVEGEIIAGRGNYNKTVAVSFHSHHDKVNWPLFRYVIYDIPDAQSGNYTQRYSAITSGLSKHPFLFAQSPFRVLLSDKVHLKVLVDTLLSDAGEGVIVQKDAQYEYGRATGLAKIKVRRDADAQVLRVNELSCTCKLVNGETAEIPFCDDFDPSKLKAGDIVSYYYKAHLQSGKPKQGEIYKVRYDLSWEELANEAQNVAKRKSIKEAIGSRSLFASTSAKNKMGHWNKPANLRTYFDEFARTSGFDPLVPENWYTIRTRALRSAGASGLLNACNYNLPKALSRAYPESKFDKEKFRTHARKGYWSKLSNVRAFFDEYARTSRFDPLVPENWYHVKSRDVHQVGGGLLNHFRYSLKTALSSAYPELKFNEENFRTRDNTKGKMERGHWNKVSNVRAFFDGFARTSGFDPLVPENWYPIGTRILREAGGNVLKRYDFKIERALSSTYPELKFNKEKFRTRKTPTTNKVEHGHWNKSTNARAFLDAFARTAGFDPLVPKNWYEVSGRALRHAGGAGLLNAHKYNLMATLSSAYPELKFKEENFITQDTNVNEMGHWKKVANVRAFFDAFAKTAGFDPLVPNNWSQVNGRTLRKAKGSGLFKAYSYNIKKALVHAYPELDFEAENHDKTIGKT